MTNNEFLTLILSRIGKRQSSDYLRSAALLEIQVFLQQREMTMEELPWFLETVDTRNLVPGQWFLDLPSDFLREIEETVMIGKDLESGEIFEITKKIPAEVDRAIAKGIPGKPKFYSIYGNRWIFGPTPNKAYQISIPYARKSTIFLANDMELSDWCLHATQAVSNTIQEIIASQHLQDPQMAALYRPLAAQAWAQFKDYCNARKYANVEVFNGEDNES